MPRTHVRNVSTGKVGSSVIGTVSLTSSIGLSSTSSVCSFDHVNGDDHALLVHFIRNKNDRLVKAAHFDIKSFIKINNIFDSIVDSL